MAKNKVQTLFNKAQKVLETAEVHADSEYINSLVRVAESYMELARAIQYADDLS